MGKLFWTITSLPILLLGLFLGGAYKLVIKEGEEACVGYAPHLSCYHRGNASYAPNLAGTKLADGTYWGPWDPKQVKFEGDVDSVLIDRVVEVMASGFFWAEGPVWWQREQSLFFSDVPGDKIYRLTKKGVEVFIDYSGGYDGKTGSQSNIPNYEDLVEHGSNGLAVDGSDLLICHHGIRSVTKVKLTDVQSGKRHSEQPFKVLADKYEGKRLNSPNDVAADRHGAIWFTDPAYGFMEREKKGSFKGKTDANHPSGNPIDLPYLDEKSKELGPGRNGVYRLKNGKVDLVIDSLERPNGIAFSCDGQTLFVSNSQKDKTSITAYKVSEEFPLKAVATFEQDGCCFDGFEVDQDNRVWTSTATGVAVIDVLGNKEIAKIDFGTRISNVAFGEIGDVWVTGLGHVWKFER